ncbi:MAG: hypothetical protein IJQ59_03895 [Bacteroidaceae bacterium]|nr:hypothetical protein [Bacteroidaceae bacterium]
MKLKYLLLFCLVGIGFSQHTAAQSTGCNSSYSRFGLGLLRDQTNSNNRAMGGVAQALRSGNRVNYLNPASNSAVDSLTFLFDVGMSLQRTRMVQGDMHKGVNNTSFDFAMATFRLRKHLGMTLGFTQYSDVGYTFTKESVVGNDLTTGELITSPAAYAGQGGLHLAFMGVGWEPFKGFSIGANLGLLWGTINHEIATTYYQNNSATANDGNLTTVYDASLLTWKGDVGVQYQTLLNATNRLTFGATVGIGHKIKRDATYYSSYSAETVDDLTIQSVPDAYQLPMTYSFGVAWEHAERLLVAADAGWEQWGKCTAPFFDKYAGEYKASTDAYMNRLRINVGAEYVPGRYDRPYQRRMNYRFGAFCSSPYLKVNGFDGPKEFGLTAGVGLPIANSINNRSYVNVGLQWTHRSASAEGLITENVMSINIGLTFNERWFMKWKFK